MNYNTASDFEVNKRLAELLTAGWEAAPKSISEDAKREGGVLIEAQGGGYCAFHYSKWSDLGPLFEEHYEHLSDYVWYPEEDYPEGTNLDIAMKDYNCGLKRAAAIYIIQLLEGKA